MCSAGHRASEADAAKAVGLRAWHCDRCNNEQMHELLAFSHQLVESETISEVRHPLPIFPAVTYLDYLICHLTTPILLL